MPFLNWCLILSRKGGCLVCAAPIHLGRQPGLLPGFPLFGVSGSLQRLRRRVPPYLIGSFELIKLLLSMARGPVNPTPASHDTTTTTRTTGVNTRNTGAVPKIGVVSISLRAWVRVRKRTKFECALPFPSSFSGSFGFWFPLWAFVLCLLLLPYLSY